MMVAPFISVMKSEDNYFDNLICTNFNAKIILSS